MKIQYEVIATGPTAGTGSTMDIRKIGPFANRDNAEEAAARLVDDPRRWSSITIRRINAASAK